MATFRLSPAPLTRRPTKPGATLKDLPAPGVLLREVSPVRDVGSPPCDALPREGKSREQAC